MTMWKILVYLLAASVVIAMSACGENEDTGTQSVKEEAKEAVEATKDYAAEKKDEFTNQLEEQLNGLEGDMAALQDKAQELSGEAKDSIQTQLNDLQDEKAAVQEKFEELQQSSQDNWDEMKKELDQAWQDLQQQYQNLETSINQQLE